MNTHLQSSLNAFGMRSIDLTLRETQCLTLPPCGHVFIFSCAGCDSAQPEIPLFLMLRFGVQSPLSHQWFSAGNTPGECGCACTAPHPL